MHLVLGHAILILPLCYFIGILRILRFHFRIYIILSIRYHKWLKCVFNVHCAVHSFGYIVVLKKKYPRKLVQCIAKCFPTCAKIFMNTQHYIDLFISKKIFIRMVNFCLEFSRYNLKSLSISNTESLFAAVEQSDHSWECRKKFMVSDFIETSQNEQAQTKFHRNQRLDGQSC